MRFRKLLCYIGRHKYRTVECTHVFHTEYRGHPRHHMVWYKQCSCCGKRIMKDTVEKDVGPFRHNGVEYARVNWVENGVIYLGNGEYKKPQPPTPIKPKLKIIPGGK